jgi:hypothetical protein
MALGSSQPPVKWIPFHFPGVNLAIYLCLLPRLRMGRNIPLLYLFFFMELTSRMFKIIV